MKLEVEHPNIKMCDEFEPESAPKKAKHPPLHSDSIGDSSSASNFRDVKILHFHLELKINFENQTVAAKELIDIQSLKSFDEGTEVTFQKFVFVFM